MIRPWRLSLFLLSWGWGLPGCLSQPQVRGDLRLAVKVIYAHNGPPGIDPRLRSLVGQFDRLNFTAYQLRDEATFDLEPNAAGRLQLPDHQWLTLVWHGSTQEGAQRVDVALDHLQFAATVALSAGATLAVGGAPYTDGTLLVAITALSGG